MAGAKLLSDAKIRSFKPREKAYRVSDAQGLYIQISPSGARLWRLRYSHMGTEKMLALGKYPAVSLAAARKARDEAREELAAGRDPSLTRKQLQAKAANTHDDFKAVSEAWLALNGPRWSERHVKTLRQRLAKHVWPRVGSVSLGAITPPMVLQLCRGIEKGRPSQIAQRVRQYMSAIFCYGIASGLTDTDPAAQIGSVLLPVSRKSHHPAITDLAELRGMMWRIERTKGKPVTKLAFRMLALTAVRSAELRGMRWEEIDFDAGLWEIPAARMKMSRPHTVPLSRQALEILAAIHPLTGRAPLVFAGDRQAHLPLSDMTLSKRFKKTRYDGRHVPHGFRSSFSSIMNEQRPRDRSVIEQMLAHEIHGSVEGAYNRAAHTAKRKEIAQEWADLLLEGGWTVHELMRGPRN